MTEQTRETGAQSSGDPAALAFETLREEVALVRRAVAGLAAERAAIEIPDYSETLGQITRMVSAIGKRLVALSEMPALRLTVDNWGHEIAMAGEQAKREDRETFRRSTETLQETTRQLSKNLASARLAAHQRRLLIWTGGAGTVAGMLLWALILGPTFHTLL